MRPIARVLAAGVVAGWADDGTFGSTDAAGVTVTDRHDRVATRVSWDEIASVVRRGLATLERGRIAAAYGRYVDAALAGTGSARLRQRASAAELAQLRRAVIDAGLATTPAQPTLFDPPAATGRGRP